MAVRDTRFGGNLERANTGIRSLPQRDRQSYGQYGSGFDASRRVAEDKFLSRLGGFNVERGPDGNVFRYPGEDNQDLRYDAGYNIETSMPFNVFPQALSRGIPSAGFQKYVGMMGDLEEKEKQDLIRQGLEMQPEFSAYPLTRSDVDDLALRMGEEDSGMYSTDDIESYYNQPLQGTMGRANPFVQELTGTGDIPLYDVRTPQDIAYGYNIALPRDAQATRPTQYIPNPSDRQPGINNPFMPSDRQPGLNNPFMPSDRQPGLDYLAPALPPENIGFDRSPNPQALPPENIGVDRDPFLSSIPENIGVDRGPLAPEVEDGPSMLEKILPFLPLPPFPPGSLKKGVDIGRNIKDYFSPDDIYQDPIMDMAKFQEYEDRGLAPMMDLLEQPPFMGPDKDISPMNDEFDMSEADSYSPQNLIQLYQGALDAGNEDEAEMYLNDLQLLYPTLV